MAEQDCADLAQQVEALRTRLATIEHRARQVRSCFLDSQLKWEPREVVDFLLGEEN